MKVWKNKIQLPKKDAKRLIRYGAPVTAFGKLTVKELTDSECSRSKLNYAPASHGFVNLFDYHKKYVGWCGIFYAGRLIIHD